MIDKFIILLIICFFMYNVKENFSKRDYIIPNNTENNSYIKTFNKILDKITNRISINIKVWKLTQYNKNDFIFIKKYFVNLLVNIFKTDKYNLDCNNCKIMVKEYKIISVSKNILNDYLVDFIISIHIDNIPELFTINTKTYIKQNAVPIIIYSKLIGISGGDKIITNEYKKYDYAKPNNMGKIIYPNNIEKILMHRKKNSDYKSVINKNTGNLEIVSNYKCYGSEGKTKTECENNYTIDGKKKEKGVWDKPCINNDECPFYEKNNKGVCKDGLCVMPKGVKRIGSKKYRLYPNNFPKCSGCLGKTENCCFNKIDKDIFDKNIDYIFN